MAPRLNGQRITRLRAQWAPQVEAGLVDCRECRTKIKPGQEWDLGHEHDLALGGHPAGPMLPEHARSADCPAGGNRGRGARLGNELRRARRARRRLDQWLP